MSISILVRFFLCPYEGVNVTRAENVCKEKKSVMTSPVGAQTATVQTEHGEGAGVTEGASVLVLFYD